MWPGGCRYVQGSAQRRQRLALRVRITTPGLDRARPSAKKGARMSVGKIALGVFLGNLAFGMLAFLVFSFLVESQRSQATVDEANASYNAMMERRAAENLSSPQP